jgi:hypothetical protein
MPEFMVAIDHITYYAVQAEDEVTAIDLVLEGQGLEISSETRDAYISDVQSTAPRRRARHRAGASRLVRRGCAQSLAAEISPSLRTNTATTDAVGACSGGPSRPSTPA